MNSEETRTMTIQGMKEKDKVRKEKKFFLNFS